MGVKLELKNVYKVFGKQPKEAMTMIGEGLKKDDIFERTGMTVGVSDATFSIDESEIFVVMGLSGSGKSTLVRMLNRLIEPTSGEIILDGRDIIQMKRKDLIEIRRKEISMVFQSFALMPHQTVLQNAAFGLEVAGNNKGEREKKALDALHAVGLKANAHSYPDELSGGMKQRVGLARALAGNPAILLMDEAFSALDPLIRTEMQDELLRLQGESSRTVVFITHDLDEAMRVGDRIAIMQGGDVVQVGSPEEIVRSPANDYVKSFFHGVDVSQVFTAGDIASRKQVEVLERPGTSVRAALSRMSTFDRELAFVHDRDRKWMGAITLDSLEKARKALSENDDGSIESAFVPEIEPAPADTPLSEVMAKVTETPWPLPIIDSEQHYVGAISKTTLLQTLDRSGEAS